MDNREVTIELPPEGSLDFQLGFISGQLRELIHGSNTNSGKLDSIGLRVAALENDKQKRDGMSEIIRIVLKSPIVGWIVAAVAFAWAKMTHRI